MRHKGIITAVVGCAVAGLFAAGLLRLFLWRFAVGDIYPPYSSYRRDPLGCMALHEALNRVSGRRAVRLVDRAGDLPDGNGRCLLMLGCHPGIRLEADAVSEMDRFMADGGRVVIALAPVRRRQSLFGSDEHADRPEKTQPPENNRPTGEAEQVPGDSRTHLEEARKTQDRQAAPEPTPADRETQAREDRHADWRTRRRRAPLLEHWELAVGTTPFGRDGAEWPHARRTTEVADLPEALPWHSHFVLVPRHSDWQTVYAVEGESVLVTRPRGAGSLVVMTDAYYFSNESMRRSLQPAFLSWVAGRSSEMVFEETHLGIAHRGGIVGLARSYRLEGFLLGVAGLSLLFVWQCTSRFLPPPEDRSPGARATLGRAAHGALSDLLRRHVPTSRLPRKCVETWRAGTPLSENERERKSRRMQGIVAACQAAPGRRRNRVQTYNRLVDIAHERTVRNE